MQDIFATDVGQLNEPLWKPSWEDPELQDHRKRVADVARRTTDRLRALASLYEAQLPDILLSADELLSEFQAGERSLEEYESQINLLKQVRARSTSSSRCGPGSSGCSFSFSLVSFVSPQFSFYHKP